MPKVSDVISREKWRDRLTLRDRDRRRGREADIEIKEVDRDTDR